MAAITTFRTSALLLAAVVSLTLSTSGWAEDDKPVQPSNEDVQQVARASNTFAWALYARLVEGSGKNVFFSPSSLHTALAMTYAGAQGRTAEQMQAALSLPTDQHFQHIEQEQPRARGTKIVDVPWPQAHLHRAYGDLLAALRADEETPHELRTANALWGQKGYPWRAEFLKTTQDNYGAGLEEADFKADTEAARKTINAWVEKQTKDKIKDLLAPGALDSLTRLVLTNAVYFKGSWAKPFKEDWTRDEPFKLAADKTVTAAMMHQTDRFPYAQTDLAQILSLPYAGDEVSMIVFLPKAVDGLADVEAWLAEAGPDEALGELREMKLDVALPKFTMTWMAQLNEPLAAMGMTDAFTSRAADFSGMSERAKDDGLHISAVIHKAFVDVNEEGTEAAAATAVAIATTSIPPSFRADHPFAFIIRHNTTGAILFVGRVLNPVAETKKDAKAEDEKAPIPRLN